MTHLTLLLNNPNVPKVTCVVVQLKTKIVLWDNTFLKRQTILFLV